MKIASLRIVSEVLVPLKLVVPSLVILRRIVSFVFVPVIAILASFVTVIVVTSSAGISIVALWSVMIVSPESLFFRVLTIAWFYVPNRCCLPVE